MLTLTIDEEDTRFIREPESWPVVLFRVGRRSLARSWFKHAPPSSLELENAIAAIEDEIARVPPATRASLSNVQTSDAAIRAIAQVAGLNRDENNLSLEAVERTFQRMAARAPGLPAGAEFVATLVILRELMHHLPLPTIVISSGR